MKKEKGPGTGSRYSGWRDCGPVESSYKYNQPVSHLTHRISWFGRFWTYGPLFTVHYEFDMIRSTLLPSRSPCADRSNEEKGDKGLDTLMKRKDGEGPHKAEQICPRKATGAREDTSPAYLGGYPLFQVPTQPAASALRIVWC